MKIIKKSQTHSRHNNSRCLVVEYPLGDSTLDFAIVTLTGRYPDSGCAINTVCKEVVYIQEGQGKVLIHGEEYLLNAGDALIIGAGEKFYWEGEMTLFISCTPAFTVEQHRLVKG